jgi:hypothetical protein
MVRSAEVVGAGCEAAEAHPSGIERLLLCAWWGKVMGRAGGSSTVRRFTQTTADTMLPEPVQNVQAWRTV